MFLIFVITKMFKHENLIVKYFLKNIFIIKTLLLINLRYFMLYLLLLLLSRFSRVRLCATP